MPSDPRLALDELLDSIKDPNLTMLPNTPGEDFAAFMAELDNRRNDRRNLTRTAHYDDDDNTTEGDLA